MNGVQQWKRIGFVIALAIIGLLVRSYRSENWQHQPTNPAPRPKSAAELAEERAKYRDRYVNFPLSRTRGVQQIAIAVGTNDGNWNAALATLMEDLIASPKLKTIPRLFSPDFLRDGLFRQVREGSMVPLKNLELLGVLDRGLFANEEVAYSVNDSLGGVVTAKVRLQISHIQFSGSFPSRSWEYSATGAGFKNSDALLKAEESLRKQIKMDTNNWAKVQNG